MVDISASESVLIVLKQVHGSVDISTEMLDTSLLPTILELLSVQLPLALSYGRPTYLMHLVRY